MRLRRVLGPGEGKGDSNVCPAVCGFVEAAPGEDGERVREGEGYGERGDGQDLFLAGVDAPGTEHGLPADQQQLHLSFGRRTLEAGSCPLAVLKSSSRAPLKIIPADVLWAARRGGENLLPE